MEAKRFYTTIEQSMKLAEFLNPDTADMLYVLDPLCGEYIKTPYVRMENSIMEKNLPCWSLYGLLNVLPVIIGDVLEEGALRLRMDKGEDDFNVWYDYLDDGSVCEDLDIAEKNSVDACYRMILELNKRDML